MPIYYYTGTKGLWLQLYASFPHLTLPALKLIPLKTKVKLQLLDISCLRELFGDIDSQNQLFPDRFYENILMRRDKVLLENDSI